MLQGHVFDSFLKPELRPGGAWVLSQFAGGMPPAIFLFLTGVTLAFLMDSSERRGLTRRPARVRRVPPFRLPVFPGVRLPRANVRFGLPGRVDRSAQGGHPQLHGLFHRRAFGDGRVPYATACGGRGGGGTGHRAGRSAGERSQLDTLTRGVGELHRAQPRGVRVLSLGGAPGVRHQRRQPDPLAHAGSNRRRHALDRGGRRCDDHHRAMVRGLFPLDLCGLGISGSTARRRC
jgi:hypothetical protein